MKKLILTAISLIMFAGCGPSIITIVRMRPVKVNTGDDINNINDSARVKQKDVQITVTYQNIKKLKGLSDNTAINPFCADNKELFTVFNVEIKNERTEKIYFDPGKAVMLDGLGNQLNSLSLEQLEKIYPSSSTAAYYTYSYVFNEYMPSYGYTNDYYKRRIASKTMLTSSSIYPGVKVEGLIVFEKLKSEASDSPIIMVLPELIIYENDKEIERINFKYSFIHEVSVIKE